MANDVKITNGHLYLEDGDLVLVRDINRIIQHIKTGLYLLVGDWVLDQSQGIAYFNGMRAYPEILSAQIKNAINTVDGVDTVLKYNFQQDRDNIIRITATVKVGNSEIAINEEFNPTTLGVT